jgi:flagellar biosynthesis protein FlhF
VTIKTFRGRTIADALDALKKELGRDAVILNTRTFKTGGFMGLGARTITEIIATTQPTPARARRGAAQAASPTPRGTERLPDRGVSRADDRAAMAVDSYVPSAGAPRSAPVAPAAVPAAPSAAPRAAAAQPASAQPFDHMQSPIRDVAKLIVSASAKTPIEEELAAIKRMVGHVLRTSGAPKQPALPDALLDCYRKLLEAEVASEIADEITAGVRDELNSHQQADATAVHAAVTRRLAAFIPVCADAGHIGRAPDGRPLTIALLGPTGVGKTTTVAKLAATYKLRHGRQIGLITCDTYRIAAVDQLRTYADIIGLPLRVAMTPGEVRAAAESMRDCDAVLIDTAGRSPRDAGRLEELRSMLDAASPHQRHLVLSSTSSESAMAETASAFAPLGYDRVILTKLDEAVNFGVLVNVARRLRTSLSFVTTGQEVPDHIEAGNAERLARCIMSPAMSGAMLSAGGGVR